MQFISSRQLVQAVAAGFALSATSLALAQTSSQSISSSSQPTSSQQLSDLTITSNLAQLEERLAPFASEIYTAADINKSNAKDIYAFLSQQTSVNVSPSFGNQQQQLLDMRGYGIGAGYQNIVVTLNGRRLNNIDGIPQLLSNIPLASIERIEIIKGSGAVAHGDGAMAGTINIVTRELSGASLSFAAGNNGYMSSSVAAGLREEFLALEFMADNSRSDGLRDKDVNGKKDESDADNLSLTLKVFPLDGLELRVGRDQSRISSIYGSPMTEKEFKQNPKQAGINLSPWAFPPGALNNYTEQEFRVNTNRFGVSYAANEVLSFNLDHAVEKKDSEYISPGSKPSKYDYRSTDFSSQINLDDLKLVTGVQLFDGEIKDLVNASVTEKDNLGYYLQSQYALENTLLSAGVRREQVKYKHESATEKFDKKRNLSVWDLGINHQLSSELSLFANLSSAFQTPDLNRMYPFDMMAYPKREYNSEIEPAKSKTLDIGFNHYTQRNKLKATLFYSRLKNEIYLQPVSGKNTNIDKSYKYGLELQDHLKITQELSARVNYAYTLAKIDREIEDGNNYGGKKLPGVSAHSITAGLDYQVVEQGTFSLTQNWRSRAYAAEDFENNFAQKQKAFNSTDLGYSHKIQQFTLFAQVNNLFDKKNGLWVRDNAIYPVNFSRTWLAGARVDF